MDFRRTPPNFGKRLRKRRLQLGLTQKQAAICMGASQATFCHWELGKGAPGPTYRPLVLIFLGRAPASIRKG